MKRALSAGTIAYLKYNNMNQSSRERRQSFIDINKDSCANAPMRAKSAQPTPSYMNPTIIAKSKRMSFLVKSGEMDISKIQSVSPLRRKSFIDVNIQQCCNSSKIKAIKRKANSPDRPSASYIKPSPVIPNLF